MWKLLVFLILGVFFISCESDKVKNNREIYRNFLYSISDQKEYLKVNSEKVTIKGKGETEMYFLVDFETRYIQNTLKDKVEFYFIGDYLAKVNGEFPDKYKSDFLLKIIR